MRTISNVCSVAVKHSLFLQAFIKQADIKFFSPMSFKQLQAIRAKSFPHVTAAQCEKRFLKYGGSVPLVLALRCKPQRSERLLKDQINGMTVEELKQCCKQESVQNVSKISSIDFIAHISSRSST